MRPINVGAAPVDPQLTSWIALGSVEMPDPSISWDKKDKKYFNDKARNFAARTNGPRIDWFRLQYATNSAFSRGEWGDQEDRQTYMKDGAKQSTKVELSIPLAHPMVMRFVGQAASISISAEAKSVTQYAFHREEAVKYRAIAKAIAAQQGSFVGNATTAASGFGQDEDMAATDAVRSFVDPYKKAVNSILTMQERINDYEYLRTANANIIACSGLFAMHCTREGMRLKWEFMHPYDTAYDTEANRPDMQDGEYAIHFPSVDAGRLSAEYPDQKDLLSAMARQATANATEGAQRNGWPDGRCRKMTVYWREPVWCKRGYVLKDGKPTLVILDMADPDTGEIGYTQADCITPPKNRFTEDWGDKNYHMGFVERICFCTFVPFEYTPYAVDTSKKYNGKDCADIVLDYGMYDLQEQLCDEPTKAGLPIKFAAVEYIDGYVMAPMTFAISPQRIINQVASSLVHRMNKAGGQFTWVNPYALPDGVDSSDVTFAAKDGETVELDPGAVGGAQNAVGVIDTGLTNGFYQAWGIIPQIQQIAQAATGIFDSTMGKATGSGQLVGTTELLLQQSNTMMQPFTKCYESGFKQVHQFDVQAGKIFWERHAWALEEQVGEEGLAAIMESKEMSMERFRVFVEITVNSSQLMAATDTMITEFFKLGWLDDVAATKLGGRSYPADVWEASRVFTTQKVKALQAKAEADAKAQQAAMLADQGAEVQRRIDDTYKQGMDLMREQMAGEQKAYQPVAQRLAEQQIPVPSDQPSQAPPSK